MAEEKKDTRYRNWSFIQYDDSAPDNWRDLLNNLHIPWAESPLHNMDQKEDGTPDKPHRHIVLANDNKVSYDAVYEISKLVSGTRPERIRNMSAMLRYFTHEDNKEKYHYDKELILYHCGFDPDIWLKRSSKDVREILKEIFKFIRNNDIISYSDFIDLCIENEFNDWFDISTVKHTLAVKEYIKSYAWKHKVIDQETGEVRYEGDYLRKYKE